ncbi:MAG: hypothetical protein OJF52_002278 [Nitrospira sp.]|nr:MAG: hypothetical protein OJF52_002278 [Nitrospira sp.]
MSSELLKNLKNKPAPGAIQAPCEQCHKNEPFDHGVEA